MNIEDLNPNALADIFSTEDIKNTSNLRFGAEEINTDIFKNQSVTETTTLPSTTETTTLPVEVQDIENIEKEADIFKETGKKEEPKTEISDFSGYFTKRVEEGKFVPLDMVDEKGKKVSFIPKTAEDFDEVIQFQLDYKLQEAKKELEKNWYDTKSSAWKAVSRYAEMVDDPSEIIPFLTNVRNIQSVANLDENEIEGAEQIVRSRLEQRGDPPEAIDSQIEALKTTSKLIPTAVQYKPIIIREEQNLMAQQVQQRQIENQRYEMMIQDISQKAFEAIEKPIFGKESLKKEEKAVIYDLVGQPSQEDGGYRIYTEIDKLFEKRDFETLREIALLVAKKDSFYNYLSNKVANETATSLQRKLQVAAEARTSSGKDFDEEEKKVIKTNPYNKPLRFGRG